MSSLILTENGIHLQSFQELRSDLKESWIAIFGENIDLSSSSPDGLHIDLEAKSITSISQALEAIANNLDRNNAEGKWLEILASYMNITKKGPTFSTITLTFVALEGTIITLGKEVTAAGIASNYETLAEVTIGVSGTADIDCQALVDGAIEAPSGDWSLVDSTPSGVTITAASAGNVGTEEETDKQLVARMDEYSGNGLATYGTMKQYLESITGVSTVTLSVNEEDYEVSGIPPHSFMFTITGSASDQEIADAIWFCKPTGIKSYGNNSQLITDSSGETHTMYWADAEPQKFFLRVTFTEYSEESLPADYIDQIKAACTAYSDQYQTANKDIIPSRYYGSVYMVPGILGVELLIAPFETEIWQSEPIEVSAFFYGSLTIDRVVVIKV